MVRERKCLYLSRNDVESINLSMDKIIDMIELLLKEKGNGFIELPPKKWLHPEKKDSFFSSMPCQFKRLGLVGCKWQSGFPTNTETGLPYIIGLIVLNDIETGYPIAILDSSCIVSMRTAAASAVAAKYFSRKDPKTLAIIGCGVQGRTHVESLLRVRPSIEEIRAFDIKADTLEEYVQFINSKYGVPTIKANTPEEAAKGSDIIVTAGVISSRSSGHLDSSVIKEGAFVCPVDYDSYWKKETFECFDKIYTDDLETLNDHREDGYFQSLPSSMPELSQVVVGKAAKRENEAERILFMNIGIGASDIIVADGVYQQALSRNLGQWLII